MTGDDSSIIEYLPVTMSSILFISQIVAGSILLSGLSQVRVLAYLGVALYVGSGLVFGMLPVLEFRRKGGVDSGKSYIHTTTVVDTGVYSIVRHPQFVTFILWSLAGMLLFQHWIVVLLGIPVLPLTYVDLMKADRDAIEKFGEEYREYMGRVPRANFVLGVVRRLRRG